MSGILRHVCVTGLLATGAFAPPLQAASVSHDSPDKEPSLAFGATNIDIALTIAATAQQSLTAAPDTDVSGQMTFRDTSGANQTYDVTIHIKGQVGSRRPLDEKPAFKVKLSHDDRFFGLERLTLNTWCRI